VNTAAIAIIISVFSLLVAAFSLGWNVYRDVLLKARIKVSIGIKNIYFDGAPPSPEYIGISATNHGPGKVILNTIELRDTSILKKLLKTEKFAMVMHDYKNPYSGKLPCTLDVGESLSLLLDHEKESFLKEQVSHVGLVDSFGRSHWASKKTVKRLNSKWRESFGNDT